MTDKLEEDEGTPSAPVVPGVDRGFSRNYRQPPITFFTVPKPFEGHIGIIQRNAIQSWQYSNPGCEIILFGNEPGVKEFGMEIKAWRVPDVKKNEYGTPMLDDVFRQAQVLAQNKLLCYVNSDIIFTRDFNIVLEDIRFKKYLAIGRRTNIDNDSEVDFGRWYGQSWRIVASIAGTLDGDDAIDYFLFPKVLNPRLLPFAVGRAGWDNWLIYSMRYHDTPVIDCTDSIPAFHQRHGYTHVQGKTGEKWEGPETEANRALIGSRAYRWNIGDANYRFWNGELIHAPITPTSIYRSLILSCPKPLLPALVWAAERFVKVRNGTL